jgi:hypothetical protein
MARTYKRDARGRFSSGGGSTGGGSKGKGLKRGRAQLAEARGKVQRAKGKLAAMDPADQTIKSSLSKRAQRGAVTKAEKRLATVKRTAVIKTRRVTGTIGKPKELKPGALKPRPQVAQVSTMPGPSAKPPRIADTMRETMRALAQSDARFYRSLEKDFGIKVKVPKTNEAATISRANIQSAASNTKSASQTLRAGLRELARSDAQRLREIQDIARSTGGSRSKLSGGKSNKQVKGSSRKRLKGGG